MSSNITIDLAVITLNEENTIKKCLDSVPFANQKYVIDSHSTDQTREIASTCGAQVIERDWPGYPKQKQFALDQCKADWILVLDADEWLTDDAVTEIKNVINNNHNYVGYEVPRYQIFMNNVLTTGKGVDYPLRLIKNGKAQYNDREIHEEIIPDGSVGRLKHGMEHLSSSTINERLDKMKRDVEMEMNETFSKECNFKNMIISPCTYFLSYLIKKKTWKDGLPGIIWLALFSIQNFLIVARHFENNNKK
jgi:glycosyltransferase involved in cell wall biosynthesis